MELPNELRRLVHQSVAILGEVIQRELGSTGYRRIEWIRQEMVELRTSSLSSSASRLRQVLRELKKLKAEERRAVAQSFTMMLELMNACENAYRSFRLQQKKKSPSPTAPQRPEAIIYVLTAHPTEARSPENIAVFHEIQKALTRILFEAGPEMSLEPSHHQDLFHLLEIAWRVAIVRNRSPKVKDEAEHIYSLLFREGVLFSLLEISHRTAPFYIRTWVGGDKDGHPGVDEKVLLQSLSLSRLKLLKVAQQQIRKVRGTVEQASLLSLLPALRDIEKNLRILRHLRRGDAGRVRQLRQKIKAFQKSYHHLMGSQHPEWKRLCQLLHVFPGLVVPLELRESSQVLMSSSPSPAIERMLQEIARLSQGGDPRWYARGFIISMTESLAHIQAAARLQKKTLGDIQIPIIPLFEEASSLAQADQIVQAMLSDASLRRAAREHWRGLVEMMVGYSDSSKEAGVLASRLSIAEALPKLEAVCERHKFTPVFFHGSGGSVDRGGGSIEDQTAWWPQSALRRYKVTVQGEMVERSLASPEIAQRQIESIFESASDRLGKKSRNLKNSALSRFAQKVSRSYRRQIEKSDFLSVVEKATPYSFLTVLKIGSRPTKRSAQLTIQGLRAIPWVLCWTQTRVLFQTWWGVGSAWASTDESDRLQLRAAFAREPVFQSYIKALGFTLAKVELGVWRMYLEQSSLSEPEIETVFGEFVSEFENTVDCFQSICGEEHFLWFRPWLGESIQLRSSMIHPLNLLQILARQEKDVHLLRLTVTGISSGMLTTG